MADAKQDGGIAEHIQPEAPAAPPDTGPSDVVVDADKIDELMAQQRAAAREKVEQEEPPAPEVDAPTVGRSEDAPPAPDDRQEWEKTSDELAEEQKKPRRGRPPKAEKAEPGDEKAAKPRRGRPPKADKAAPDAAKPQRDKVDLLTKYHN